MNTNADSHFQSFAPGNAEQQPAPGMSIETPELRVIDVQHTTHAFIALNQHWQVVYISQQAELLLQRTREELLGKNIWEVFPDYVGSPLHHYCLQAASSGKAAHFEVNSPYYQKWLRIHIYPSPDDIAIFLTDITEQTKAKEATERKQAEEQLHRSEKHFRALIENNADGIALTDANGIITYVSPSMTRIAGFLPQELVGHCIFERMVYADDREATRRILARVFEEPGKSLVLEYRTRHKDGALLWIKIVGINLLDEPNVEAIIWNYRDITQRKQLEQEIARAKEQLEVILHNVADGIAVVDANGSAVYTNDILARMAGFSSAADLLASPRAILQQLSSRFAIWDEQGKPISFKELPSMQALQGKLARALIKHKDTVTGQIYWTLVRAQPIVDTQKQVQFAVSVFTDMTEQKELEQRKDNFISMASHELKTPLTVLSAFTQLLREQFEAEGRKDVVLHLTKMDEQITKLTRLVVDLLDISRMQAGTLELEQETIDVAELVQEVVENLQHTTRHRLLIDGAVKRTIIGDRDRLGQVLMNLLTNAIKYSPQADTILVRVTQTQDTLLVSVQDFGIGIAQNHQERLFERFYRVFSEKDKTYPGLGIGLYIAYEIIQRHGGKMWVESAVGKGSTFYFSLPLR